MADTFRIIPYQVRSAGTDVPPEEVQAAVNSLAQQTTLALNSVASDPTGPAGGDLSGTYPNPTVAAVHATSGTLNGVVIGGVTPAAGHFTTVDTTTAIAATSGGTGRNALTANAVLIGEGSSQVNFAPPGAAGTLLGSNGVAVDPTFQTAASLGLAQLSGATFTGPVTISATTASFTLNDTSGTGFPIVQFNKNGTAVWGLTNNSASGALTVNRYVSGTFTDFPISIANATGVVTMTDGIANSPISGSTGSFTTLAASSTVSGAGFTARFSTPGPIGNTAASTGAFTTLSSTGTFTPSSTNGIVGTVTNDNANTGSIGEYLTNATTATSLTSGANANATSVSLTAGDWEVEGTVTYLPGGTTTVSALQEGCSSTSATFGGANTGSFNLIQASLTTAGAQIRSTPMQRFSLSTTTTVFLVVNAAFGVSTMTCNGFIRARRVR